MLEHQKKILKEVIHDEKLFAKELFKSKHVLSHQEKEELFSWVRNELLARYN